MSDQMSGKALAAGESYDATEEPAANALPLTGAPRDLAEIDTELKIVTDRILTMIGGLSK